jgi:hypothetical protein
MAARVAVLALLVPFLLVAATPAAAARDRCPRTTGGAPLSARIASPEETRDWRTTLVACDRRTGRERVLRRAVLRRTGVGRVIADASVAGRRVAWLESIQGRSRGAAAVLVANGRTGRIVRRRYVLDSALGDPGGPVGVALTTRGELAWTVGPTEDDMRVVLALPAAAPRELARGRVAGLGLEDDGTLLWHDGRDGLASYDLPGRDFGAGCPKRRREYAPTGLPKAVVFTQSTWAAPPFGGEQLRACDAASGVDAVVATASYDGDIGGDYVWGAGGGNGWAAILRTESNRYDQCGTAQLRTVNVHTRARGRQVTQSGCSPATPWSAETLATAAGAPVWLTKEPTPRLVTVSTDGTLIELDRGDVRDLRTEGDDVAWTSGGEPRRARP